MISKEQLKVISKLLLKKNRLVQNRFLAEGKRLIEEALKTSPNCEQIFYTQHFLQNEENLIGAIRQKNIPTFELSPKDFAKISSTKNSQGIIGIFKIPRQEKITSDDKIIIGLENISDPGNLGTILRTCQWFGIKSVFLSQECAEVYNPKVVRASMGAIFTLNILDKIDFYSNVKSLIYEGYQVYYADMKGQDYRSVDFNQKTVLIFCNEATGPTEQLTKVCKKSITIPSKGSIDSLNVAVAAAIIISRS